MDAVILYSEVRIRCQEIIVNGMFFFVKDSGTDVNGNCTDK